MQKYLNETTTKSASSRLQHVDKTTRLCLFNNRRAQKTDAKKSGERTYDLTAKITSLADQTKKEKVARYKVAHRTPSQVLYTFLCKTFPCCQNVKSKPFG
mmetsp:Transcript_107178/g.167380  ORF Transcript_107178/g.167380 Transcript_107178/m.167380 type:complete len:100 (-) Transcript_107178:2082-2381(-)